MKTETYVVFVKLSTGRDTSESLYGLNTRNRGDQTERRLARSRRYPQSTEPATRDLSHSCSRNETTDMCDAQRAQGVYRRVRLTVGLGT